MTIDYKKKDEAARITHNRLIDQGVFPCCINCLYWDAIPETCKKFNMRPPAEVIARSCGESWDVDIPF